MNDLFKKFGMEVPIFGFSHCRDVVAEVSKAGGMGVFGVAYKTAEQLDAELKWIDERVGGKPYGIDVLLPNKYEKLGEKRVTPDDLPQAQVEFMRRVLDEAGIPRLPEGDARTLVQEFLDRINIDISLVTKHSIKSTLKKSDTREETNEKSKCAVC